MIRHSVARTSRQAFGGVQVRTISKLRHLMSIADLNADEFGTLVRNTTTFKRAIKAGSTPTRLKDRLVGQTVAMLFSKRSTRTRVSTEAAVVSLGGHPMFLGMDDIQLGVNESLRDTSTVISSMTSCMVARVGPHSDITGLAKHSSVPVINALSDDFHPLQTIADFATIAQVFSSKSSGISLGLDGLKIAWIGDSNNVLFDLAIACVKMGVHIAVASPPGYGIPQPMRQIINSHESKSSGVLTETTVPEEAVKNADILVTDTWISMGQEADTERRLKDFEGFQITKDLANRGRANEGWKFMHCLPRHKEEVTDEVFYGPRSLVFAEAANRLWAAIAVLDAFVIRKGNVMDPPRQRL